MPPQLLRDILLQPMNDHVNNGSATRRHTANMRSTSILQTEGADTVQKLSVSNTHTQI